MSMFSTATSKVGAVSAVTVARKGYRLTTTASMAPMPCSSRAARCSGTSRRARMPPWTPGCSVFTRPAPLQNPLEAMWNARAQGECRDQVTRQQAWARICRMFPLRHELSTRRRDELHACDARAAHALRAPRAVI